MNTLNDEQALLKRIAGLPRDVQPRNDLWPAIAQRIDPALKRAGPATRSFPVWPAAIAASLLVAFAMGVLFTRSSGTTSSGPAPVDLAEVQGMAHDEPAIVTLPSASESEYLAAFREFLAIHPAPLPETVPAADWIGETRKLLHQTEVDLAAALSQSPGDPLLQERMAALRAYQLEWLKQMAAAERNSRRIST